MILYLFGLSPEFNLVVAALNLLLLLAMIFLENKNPDKVLKWIAVLLFIPLLGFILYLYLGLGPSLGKRKRMLDKIDKDDKYLKALNAQMKVIDGGYDRFNYEEAQLIKYNLKENHSFCTTNNAVKVYSTVYEQYLAMFEDMENAKHEINVCYFIIKKDPIGQKLIDVLAQKAKEGVTVRLVIDDFGCLFTPKSFFKPIIENGGKVYRFMPTHFKILLSQNVNYRNHRKIVVIDKKIGYMGGANIGKEYIGGKPRVAPWKDCHIRIEGNAVNALNMRFVQDFNFACKEEDTIEFEPIPFLGKLGNHSVQIVSSGPDSLDSGIQTAYIKAIYMAKESIILQTPYLILNDSFQLALVSAARSGINVKIVLPGKPDKRFVYHSTCSFAKELYEAGVEIYFYDGFMHSKTLVIDDSISSVGTFNLDRRSFYLHFEVTAFIYGKEFNDELRKIVDENIAESKKLDDEYLKNRSLWRKFMERVSILFSPLL